MLYSGRSRSVQEGSAKLSHSSWKRGVLVSLFLAPIRRGGGALALPLDLQLWCNDDIGDGDNDDDVFNC